ncbi:unnamed protein product [Dibothriocephalus latus]|uniref:Uncharacterized protein n=1 Tax=Dibothriocephalus latus TaxID=60516 RepID=A0A3P6Q5W9_DIBLA|nr:unnamed protein product [Dibothriocephalus latus]
MRRLTARTTNPLFSTNYLQLANKSDSLKSNSLNVVSPLPEYVADITSSARYDLLQDSPPDLTRGPLSCSIRPPNDSDGVIMERKCSGKLPDEIFLKNKRKLESEATGFL